MRFFDGLLGGDARSPEARRGRAIGLVMQGASVSRVDRSFILAVSFTGEDRELAAAIANALADGYIADQLDAKYEATRLAAEWLEHRIEQLRQESLTADLAVQNFRAENNLVAVDGQLVSEQQVAAINAELVKASSDTASAKARLDQINEIIASGSPDALVADALDSSVINQLRTKYLEAARREANVVKAVGADHEQAVRLRAELQNYQDQIAQELKRIAESYESEYQVAKAREDALRASLGSAANVNATNNTTLAKLRELEMEADSVRNLYQNFLTSYQNSAERASFPLVEARVVTRANPPSRPAWPLSWLVLAAGTFLGTLAGGGLAGVREFRDRFVRTGEQLRTSIGVEFLGLVPLLHGRPSGHLRVAHAARDGSVPHRFAVEGGSVMSYAADHPLSQFAETLRSAKVGADLALADQQTRIIGMASILPEEGKSTCALNFGMLLASAGARTLLIDCDIRNPSLSNALAADAQNGLIEAIITGGDLVHFVQSEVNSGLDFLPVGAAARTAQTVDVLSSPGFDGLLGRAGAGYDYVILDLPPIGAVVDARAISSRVNAFVLIVQWGRVPRQLVRTTLRSEPRIAAKCIGAILNKVNLTRHRLYSDAGTAEAHQASYRGYYIESDKAA
ncbi:MAG TPA: AAA family ATPase [Alphaproteobacteria bacterium]|nr:AAA family ATPase [Alphaproteobacteria bacterium]